MPESLPPKPVPSDLSALLQKYRLRPSYQRIRILKYLLGNRDHPTADQIYRGLRDDMPTLSKATVYNTLHAFLDAGLVRSLSVDEKEARYDIVARPHGHFSCDACGALHNFEIDIESLPTDGLDGFRVEKKEIVFRGSCPQCTDPPDRETNRRKTRTRKGVKR